MMCPVTVRLGVYALGAADEAERMLIQGHLPVCQACQEELALLEPLPGLLARVTPDVVRTGSHTRSRAGKVRASPRRLRGIVSLAAAAVLGAGGFWLAQQTGSQQTGSQQAGSPQAAVRPAAAVTLSGANPVTNVRVTITLTATSWGTSIQLLASGLPVNQQCELIVRSRAGAAEVAGTWNAWSAGPVTIPASAGWLPRDIGTLQVATPGRNLVTVTAAHGP